MRTREFLRPEAVFFTYWRTLAAGALLILTAVVWAHTLGPNARAGYDFESYIQAARAIATGASPYHRLIEEIARTRVTGQTFSANGYIYPPLLATALVPLIIFGASYHALWLFWVMLNIAATLWIGVELNRALRKRHEWSMSLLFACGMALPAVVIYDLSLGQTDLLMAALAVGACALWLRDSHWAPIVLGVGVAIKPTLALLILVWLWKRDWRAAIAAGVVSITLILAPFAFAGGLSGLRDYWIFLANWNAFQGSGQCINQSAYGVTLRAVSANPCAQPLLTAPWLVVFLRFGLALATTAIWLRAVPPHRDASQPRGMIEALLALPVLLIISPLSEDIHYCLLVPPLLALVWLASTQRRLRRIDGALALIALGALYIPRMQELIYPNHLLTLPGQSSGALGVLITQARSDTLFALAVVTLVAGAAALIRRQSTSDTEPSTLSAKF